MWTDEKRLTSRVLNVMGAQPVRAYVAEGLRRRRRPKLLEPSVAEFDAVLERDGIIAIPDYYPAVLFAAMRAEVRRLIEGDGLFREEKFGAVYEIGRILKLDAAAFPALHQFALDPVIRQLASSNQGQQLSSEDLRPQVYRVRTVPNASDENQESHADTFHATTKGWLYLHDVDVADGCFWYARGSHRITNERLRFEYEKSLRGRGNGSWRLEPGDERVLGCELAPVPVRANTLVIANTCGFHRRGDTDSNAFRDTLHFSARVSPFRG